MLCVVQLRSGCVTGGHNGPVERLAATWTGYESVALGVIKYWGWLWHYTVIIPEHTNILQSIIMGKRAVESCPLPEAVPWDWHWCVPHWAKAWVSLAESVSPFGSALALAVKREWMWQKAQEEGRERILPSEQRLCGIQHKNLYFLHPFMLW